MIMLEEGGQRDNMEHNNMEDPTSRLIRQVLWHRMPAIAEHPVARHVISMRTPCRPKTDRRHRIGTTSVCPSPNFLRSSNKKHAENSSNFYDMQRTGEQLHQDGRGKGILVEKPVAELLTHLCEYYVRLSALVDMEQWKNRQRKNFHTILQRLDIMAARLTLDKSTCPIGSCTILDFIVGLFHYT